jgi:NAD(P)-dependent dehydrogenase (short-subunit alcohol dehydrogenase family)
MTQRLQGKRAVVTDCGQYNGADIAALFREEGAHVIADSSDLTKPGAAEALIRDAGHVDILIANLARPFAFHPAAEQPDDEMTRLMEAIFYPLHRLVRAVLPQMLGRKRGKIVVAGSTAGIKGRSGGVALYAAARGAQHAYMRNLAQEVAPYVNVNATAQSYVDNLTYWPHDYRQTEEFRQRMAEVPAARLGSGRELAQTVLFLAGPESDFFYGQIIPFAGGWAV